MRLLGHSTDHILNKIRFFQKRASNALLDRPSLRTSTIQIHSRHFAFFCPPRNKRVLSTQSGWKLKWCTSNVVYTHTHTHTHTYTRTHIWTFQYGCFLGNQGMPALLVVSGLVSLLGFVRYAWFFRCVCTRVVIYAHIISMHDSRYLWSKYSHMWI